MLNIWVFLIVHVAEYSSGSIWVWSLQISKIQVDPNFHVSISSTNITIFICVCLKMSCTPLYPMVLLIIKSLWKMASYFIGKMNPTFSVTNPITIFITRRFEALLQLQPLPRHHRQLQRLSAEALQSGSRGAGEGCEGWGAGGGGGSGRGHGQGHLESWGWDFGWKFDGFFQESLMLMWNFDAFFVRESVLFFILLFWSMYCLMNLMRFRGKSTLKSTTHIKHKHKSTAHACTNHPLLIGPVFVVSWFSQKNSRNMLGDTICYYLISIR